MPSPRGLSHQIAKSLANAYLTAEGRTSWLDPLTGTGPTRRGSLHLATPDTQTRC